jgi:hypothetical protein
MINIYLIGSSVIGMLRAIRAKSLSLPTRIGLALIPALAVLVVWDWFSSLVMAPVLKVPYSGCRLAPALGLIRGYSPYPPFERGPIVGWFYPPISVLALLPAALIPDPTAAVLAGRFQSLLYGFAPVIWLLALEVRRGRLKAVNAAVMFLVFALLANRLISLRYVTTEVHADAPALALGCIALGLVGRIRGAAMSPAWYGAIVASILAAWTKQAQVFLLLVPIFRAFTSFGFRTGLKVLAITTVLAVAIAGLLLLAFDFRNCKFYIFDVIRLQRWKGETTSAKLEILGFALGVHMQRPLLVFLAVLLALLMIGRARPDDPPATPRDYPTWLPFLLGGIVELPMSLMGYLKAGGDFNLLSFSVYPLLVASVLLMGRLVDSRPGRELLLMALALYMGASEYRLLSRQLRQSEGGRGGTALSWIDEQRLIMRYLQVHPGQAYFPFNTLEHLAIDRRRYHFPDGVMVLASVGYRISDRNIRDHTPAKMRLVCYPPSFREDDGLLNYVDRYRKDFFPGFRTPVTVPELPGFFCFARTPPVLGAEVGREDPVE